MNKFLYQIKRLISNNNKKSFSINNNCMIDYIIENITINLHNNYNDYKLIKMEYDDSVLIDGIKKSKKIFSIFFNKYKNNFIGEITIVSHGEFNADVLVNHILNIFDIQNNKNVEDEPLLENEKIYIDVSYKRECFDGLYHDVYTLTTLKKG